MLTFLLLSAALAGDELSGNEITYEGSLSQSAAGYVQGKPVTISHSGGNISVRCMDTPGMSARLPYTIYGTSEGPMQSMGNGIGLSAYGDSKGGSVKTRVPSKPSGVSRAEMPLTVNIPAPTTSLTVTQTGSGWVQVIDCDGAVKVTAGSGGAYVSGKLTSAVVTATGGDVKVVQNEDAVFSGTTSITASNGNATVQFASAQGGKLTASATEITSSVTVVGTNSSSLIQGDLGVAGPNITISAPKGKLAIEPNK